MESQKHGTDGKRRVWRKLHLAIDTDILEIIATELSLSNVTDAEVLPNLLKQIRRKIAKISGDGAVFWERDHPRNLCVACQKLYGSNKHCKQKYGYHKRSLSETAMYRMKQLPGGKLSLRPQRSGW